MRMMRAQIKVVLLVTVILTAVLGSVIWKTHTLLITDQTSLVLDSAMKQIAPLKRLVSENLETEKNELIRFAAAREAQGPGHVTAFGTFDAVALVEPSNSQWSPSWIEKSSSLRAEKWPQGYDLTLLKSLPYARVKEGSTLWVRLSDAQGAPLFAILNSVQVQAPTAQPLAVAGSLPAAPTQASAGVTRQAILVGFANENPLASLTEDYIGSTNSVYIVDDHGYVASHVKKNYLGDSFIEDPMTKEITHTSLLSDTRVVTDLDGQRVLAHFERIEHTNLSAVIATPFTATSALASQELRTILAFGGGFGLLGLILAWIVGGTIPSGESTASSRRMTARDFIEDDDQPETFARRAIDATVPAATSHLLPEAPAGASISGSDMIATDLLLEERKTAFEAFSASFAARLREPLLAILGHAQLTKIKTEDTEVLAHVDSIEREARLAKEAIERFQIIEESENFPRWVNETCDIEKAVLSALAEKAIEIEGSGIYLDQSTTHVPRVRGRASDIESAIVHVLDNAIEAMRDRVEKRLTIQLTWKNERVRFLIKDSGIGMSREIQKRAFEPFYKGFEAPRHMGLGLSFVQTTLKQIGAKSEIESSPGEGTLVTIDFPIEAQARRDFEIATAPPVIGRG